MPDLTEQNLKQAHAAHEQLADFMTKSMSAWMDTRPPSPAAAGFKETQVLHTLIGDAVQKAQLG